jgi:2-keto-4-pentenoate hydratase/2-oxohepta-3-ene-1,7-dioic acid hydratase in catechol pathway
MRLASFSLSGRPAYGLVVDGGVIDLARRLGPGCPTLRSAIAAGRIPGARALASEAADAALSEIAFDLPIPDPAKIVCIGRNYKGHVAEGNMKLPEKPSVFLRAIQSFVPHGGALVRPCLSEQFDYEGELAVVIGKPGRHIGREAALGHVFGYTCLNDGSVRDYQFTHSLIVGKNFFRSGSIGPWIATADEIPDPTELFLRTRLNGAEVQHTKTDDLIFDIPAIISYVSDVLPLNAGDIIATGTPEGVGFARKPPLWMKAGDEIEVEISRIGILRNSVVDESADEEAGQA